MTKGNMNIETHQRSKQMFKRMITLTLFLSLICASLITGAEFKAEQPILITAAGQSADVLMAKILAQKNKLNFTLDKLVQPDSLTGYKTLIIVTGGSTKGLGAAKIDKDDELKRVQAVIQTAKKNDMSIIVMHLGGKARRGKLSDEFNKLAAENAHHLIVVQGGDDDAFFTEIAESKKISIQRIPKIINAGVALKKIFAADEK